MATTSQRPFYTPLETFHPFSTLTDELRLQVWAAYLEDATPQMYRFKISYQNRSEFMATGLEHVEAGDDVFLRPTRSFESKDGRFDDEPKYFLQALKHSTESRRTASLICVQSRQVVLQIFPDTLKFRCFTRYLTATSNRPYHHSYFTDFPERVLRFNAARDIIILDADWNDQEFAVEIARLNDRPPNIFQSIRHVGVTVSALRSERGPHTHRRLRYGTYLCSDKCSTGACRDHCQKDPLPAFLSLFPALESFNIANFPPYIAHHIGRHRIQAGDPPPSTISRNCPCLDESPGHTWPLIKSCDACGWFIVYDERSGCRFPHIERVEELRELWRSHFPYYSALDHLRIRFIQLVRRPYPPGKTRACCDFE